MTDPNFQYKCYKRADGFVDILMYVDGAKVGGMILTTREFEYFKIRELAKKDNVNEVKSDSNI